MDLPDRFAGVDARIPDSWKSLQGPAEGTVHLPNRLAWSGPASFDVADPGDRFTLYSVLLDCGQLDDVCAYINPSLLRTDWPRLRRATTSQITRRWERKFPALAA
ncbi:hypothetical protein [Catenuloplanes japonicus]|uniref:hypothetical protein n=1 Tax=Catenuloplanes japonicus TaxID=33876 RepID=UPI0012FBC41C|nr:hypothetical protein [Catenuloplanes japonicus]